MDYTYPAQIAARNPRLELLRREVEQNILKPFRSHGWIAAIAQEVDRGSYIEVSVNKGAVSCRILILYSSSEIGNAELLSLQPRFEHIFFYGQPYMVENFARGVTIPFEPLADFFPLLVSLNKRVEPDKSPPVMSSKPIARRRLTAENPLGAILTRLQQLTSVHFAAKVITQRARAEGAALSEAVITSKATGVAFSMRSALDYVVASSSDKLNKRVLGLYYGVMAFAQAEMLAAPSGPVDLDEVEGMTKLGHGLYTLTQPDGGFADLHVGVLATGFLPQWLTFLGHDTSSFPRKKPRSIGDLENLPRAMVCTLRDLFASMPEVADLFSDVFGGPFTWVNVAYDDESNMRPGLYGTGKKAQSTYGLFIDRSETMSIESLQNAGWPLAEIQPVTEGKYAGKAFRARVDHAGQDVWWSVLPTHSSPYVTTPTLLLPTVGGLREYRTIAAVTLYSLSIMARYMPSAWRRIEGGDEDQYLGFVKAALDVWERLLPEQFYESISGEALHTAQPGSFFS